MLLKEIKMKFALFIDDERDPQDVKWGTWQDQVLYRDEDWIIARNWYETLEIVVSLGFPQLISFDHDLGENERTGYEIAQKLCEMVMDGVMLPDNFEYRVHSKNPVGAENIRTYMDNFLDHYNG
jgi:hypothetical protein